MFRNALAPISLAIALSLCAPLRASGKSLGIAYGPSSQVVFSLDWQRWGLYAQPILSWQEIDSRYHRIEVGVRGGAQFAYTPFTYRALECRLLGGAGSHFATRTITYRNEAAEIERRQLALEIWMQPEFRFYERFSVLLQQQMFRYVREESIMYETEDQRADFELPDLSLSNLKIGLKYYLPFGSR